MATMASAGQSGHLEDKGGTPFNCGREGPLRPSLKAWSSGEQWL